MNANAGGAPLLQFGQATQNISQLIHGAPAGLLPGENATVAVQSDV
jgi:hypothetical protein